MQEYKDFNREIKGYVEVVYNVLDYNNEDIYLDKEKETAVYTQPLQEVFNTERELDNYAVLNDNYTQLDGSFMLFNKNTNNCGFYSDNIVINYYKVVSLFIGSYFKTLSRNMDGITIYTKNNNIISCTLKIYNEHGEVKLEKQINNNSECLMIELEKDVTNCYIELYDCIFEYNDRNIIITHIDLGLSYVYKNSDLIDFEVTEEVDKLIEKTPANELNITIGDYQKMYDPLNKTGITKYLKENVKYIPYIGIQTQKGVEYTKMGTFFFDSHNYNNKQVSIKAYNLIDKLSREELLNKTGSLFGRTKASVGELGEYLRNYLSDNYSYNYDITITNKTPLESAYIKKTSLLVFLQNACMIDGILYVNRNNEIVARMVDSVITETLTKAELKDNLKYIDTGEMSSFDLKRTGTGLTSTSETNTKNNFETKFILEEDEQIICLTSDDPDTFFGMRDEYITYQNATKVQMVSLEAGHVSDFMYMLFLKVSGTKGKEVEITGKVPWKADKISSTNEIVHFGSDKPALITVDNPFHLIKHYIYFDKFTNFINKFYNYKVNLNYNGNPKIEAGRYIEVESDYGFVKIFVTKHTLKFDGGLSGSIEGVE